jgi:hypothetical protein
VVEGGRARLGAMLAGLGLRRGAAVLLWAGLGIEGVWAGPRCWAPGAVGVAVLGLGVGGSRQDPLGSQGPTGLRFPCCGPRVRPGPCFLTKMLLEPFVLGRFPVTWLLCQVRVRFRLQTHRPGSEPW